MAGNYTSNYGLCQWEPDDKVLRTEFNADNAKIDAALASKASASALDSLKTTVDGKADKSALEGLKSTVASQGAALALRNCKVVYGSYTGTGGCGPDHPNTLTFSHKPVFLYAACGNNARRFAVVHGQAKTWVGITTATAQENITWGSRAVSWYATADHTLKPYDQMNDPDSTYFYFAVLDLNG